ncbi:MAG: hypoxanthine phosphoribosyltransferase [Bacteroidaceae bacterium]|nr:hypoxanthine phosphoribosyltransferase [Bacteroidaceae bacterium]
MDNIKVLDKTFAISIPESRIRERVAELGAAISRDLEGKNPIFLAVLNGSFVFASDLLRAVSIPCEISFIRLASYVGTSSTGNVKEVMGLSEDLEGRTVVVVEDIIDSGLTMKELLNTLQAKHPAEIRVASLLVKPENLKVNLDIPYCCFEIPNDFIVGYGLDYDGYGRNLKDIYTVVEAK